MGLGSEYETARRNQSFGSVIFQGFALAGPGGVAPPQPVFFLATILGIKGWI
jgi:hypothetical protein